MFLLQMSSSSSACSAADAARGTQQKRAQENDPPQDDHGQILRQYTQNDKRRGFGGQVEDSPEEDAGPEAKGVAGRSPSGGKPAPPPWPPPPTLGTCAWACSIMLTSALISRSDSGLPHISTQSTCQLQRSKLHPSRW